MSSSYKAEVLPELLSVVCAIRYMHNVLSFEIT